MSFRLYLSISPLHKALTNYSDSYRLYCYSGVFCTIQIQSPIFLSGISHVLVFEVDEFTILCKKFFLFFNVFSFVIFVISLNFLKFLFYIENPEITGIWRCTPATACSSVSPFRSNKKIAEHQEYAESGYPIILNVRLFSNSYRFRGSVQSSVIQLSAQSVLILNFLNLTLTFFKERSISLTY